MPIATAYFCEHMHSNINQLRASPRKTSLRSGVCVLRHMKYKPGFSSEKVGVATGKELDQIFGLNMGIKYEHLMIKVDTHILR